MCRFGVRARKKILYVQRVDFHDQRRGSDGNSVGVAAHQTSRWPQTRTKLGRVRSAFQFSGNASDGIALQTRYQLLDMTCMTSEEGLRYRPTNRSGFQTHRYVRQVPRRQVESEPVDMPSRPCEQHNVLGVSTRESTRVASTTPRGQAVNAIVYKLRQPAISESGFGFSGDLLGGARSN